MFLWSTATLTNDHYPLQCIDVRTRSALRNAIITRSMLLLLQQSNLLSRSQHFYDQPTSRVNLSTHSSLPHTPENKDDAGLKMLQGPPSHDRHPEDNEVDCGVVSGLEDDDDDGAVDEQQRD